MFEKLKKAITGVGKRYFLIISKKLGDFSGRKSDIIPVGLSNTAKDTHKYIGIVGFGNQGKAIYAGIAALAGAEVKIICDADPQKIHAAKSINKDLLCFTDLNDFINSLDSTELVIIATTAPSHLDILAKILPRYKGKILVEKPLDSSLKKCMVIKEQLTQGDSNRVFINYSKRHLPDLKNIKQILSSPVIGAVKSIHFSIGKGELAMITSHYMDYLKYLLDEYPVSVQSILNPAGENQRGGLYADNNGTCTLFYRDGITATFDFSSVHTNKDVQILIKCDNGYLFFDEYRGYILISPKGMSPFIYNSLEHGSSKIGIQRVLSDILVSDQPGVKCSFEDACEVVKIIYACHYSSLNNGILVGIQRDFEQYSSIAELKYP